MYPRCPPGILLIALLRTIAAGLSGARRSRPRLLHAREPHRIEGAPQGVDCPSTQGLCLIYMIALHTLCCIFREKLRRLLSLRVLLGDGSVRTKRRFGRAAWRLRYLLNTWAGSRRFGRDCVLRGTLGSGGRAGLLNPTTVVLFSSSATTAIVPSPFSPETLPSRQRPIS